MPPHSNPPLTPKVLSSFPPASIDEIANLLHASPNKQCDLDPILTFLLKQVSATILPIITTVVNLSYLPVLSPCISSNPLIPHSSKKLSIDKDT